MNEGQISPSDNTECKHETPHISVTCVFCGAEAKHHVYLVEDEAGWILENKTPIQATCECNPFYPEIKFNSCETT